MNPVDQKKQFLPMTNEPRRLKYLELEKELYTRYFKKEEFASLDISINNNEFIHFTVVKKVPETEDNVLLLLHGFGGFNGVYVKLAQQLADNFFMIIVDLPGMGFSYRPEWETFNDTPTAVEYFSSRMKMFIDKMDLKKFSLMGHSIGALMSAHLFETEHEKIIKLYLLSPAGFNPVGDPHFQERKKEFLDNAGFIRRNIIQSVEKRIYVDKASPFEIYWSPMWLKKWIFKKYWMNPRFKMDESESMVFAKIQGYFLTLPQSGEKCLGHLLHYGVNSKRPIIDILINLKESADKVVVFFGDHDWMDHYASKANIEHNKLEIPVYSIHESEHQLIFQNPTQISQIIQGVIEAQKLVLESKSEKLI